MIALISAALTGMAFVFGAGVVALPESVGYWLLGHAWSPVEAILIPVVLGIAGSAALVGPWTALRALGAAAASLRVGCIVAVITALCGGIGALTAHLYGAAVGLALASWASAYIWWRQYSLTIARAELPSDVDRDVGGQTDTVLT
jgi:hypothetical protein